jgi:hypothetical protein
MATDIFKSIIDKVSTVLKADANVTGLLREGANGVKEWIDESIDSVIALPQPYINLIPLSQGNHAEESSRHEFDVDVAVEYCMSLQGDGDRFQIFDDKAILDAVILGASLKDFVTTDTEKVYRDHVETSFLQETGLRKIRYEITFTYKRNK